MKKGNSRWQLAIYDAIILLAVDLMLLVFYQGNQDLPLYSILLHMVIGFVCIFSARVAGQIYRQIWRYGGIQCYIRLLLVDAVAFLAMFAGEMCLRLFTPVKQITFTRLLSISCVHVLACLRIRMSYPYSNAAPRIHPTGNSCVRCCGSSPARS